MIKRGHPRRHLSLSEVLDRVLEQGSKRTASFRKLAEAANLDPSRDFIGASLQDIDMRDEDLRGFDFSGADLTGADFRRANVQGARFDNAKLSGVIGLQEAAVVRGQPKVLHLGNTLRDLRIPIRRMIGGKVTLEITSAKDLWPVRVDASLFENVIMNLVSNASHAMPDGGKLTLRATNAPSGDNLEVDTGPASRPDSVEIDVADTGIGISPNATRHLFKPFHRVADARASRGMGLGLYLARRLVEQMDGFIDFNFELGRGSTFRISLPRYVPGRELEWIKTRWASLTPRELQVMTNALAGMTNMQIARDLGTSQRTIKLHRDRAIKKMRVRSLTDFARLAEKAGITQDQS